MSGPIPSTSSTKAARPCSCATRHWRITDATGRTEEVRGPGVVGQTPVLAAGRFVPLHLGLPARHAVRHHGGQLPDDDGGGRAHRRGDPGVLARQPAHDAQPELKDEMAPELGTAKELLARLVAFDTTSHKSNIPIIEIHRGLSARAWRRQRARADAGRAEGQPVRHHRACRCRRHRTLGPHRRGAGDEPGLGHRSVHARRARRQAVRPRRLRHEGLSRLRAGPGARIQGAQAEGADPHRLLLRRGGGLHRRAADDRRTRQDSAAAALRAGRRADQHDRRRRPQGSHALERGGNRQGGALEHAAPWRQCHHLRRAAAGRAGAHGRGA